ncbi:MAG: response regulator, partial [Pseudomonadota bacterium]
PGQLTGTVNWQGEPEMPSILLVDDDAAARDMLKHGLSNDGHVVTVAGDGQEVLDGGLAANIDIVVSDISMPGVDGITLAETLLAKQPNLPIVLMSAIADELKRAQSVGGGNVRVIGKPVTLEQLKSEISALLSG